MSPAVVAGADRFAFVKRYPAGREDLRDAEIEGLEALAATRTVAVPRILGQGERDGAPVLVLERLEPAGPAAAAAGEAAFGAALARLHRVTAPAFGWACDNFIGASVQRNGWHDDWATFFRDRRLRVQFELAASPTSALEPGAARESLLEHGAALLEQVPVLLAGHRPEPSLLHGDLWTGNWIVDRRRGLAYTFDPAVHHGDREADLAMTELFGGFGAAFRAAYLQAWPLTPGFATRRDLYNLYHLLNHANLFGGGYLAQALAAIGRLRGAARVANGQWPSDPGVPATTLP
jgi:protein-ribulosamine 3-kinase